MAVVALSTELVTVPGNLSIPRLVPSFAAYPRIGTATENFLKRWIAFMIGGAVALLMEVILLPVKARSRLVESLAAAIKHINEMESCVAFGIEESANLDVYAPEVFVRFDKASGKAKAALDAAETFRKTEILFISPHVRNLTFRQFLSAALSQESKAHLRALR